MPWAASMTATQHAKDYTVAILEESLQVLEALLKGDGGLALADVTRASGLSKNKTFRILYTLEKRQYVERNTEGAYRLGLRFLHFGQSVQERLDLYVAARPALDWLAEQTRESIFLGMREGDEALCVDARQSLHPVRLFAQIGLRAPLYAGGVPKVILAFMDAADRDSLLARLELKPLTASTVTDRERLEQMLAEIRARGVAITRDDMDEGVHSIAAPIRDCKGQVVAGVSIAGPSERFAPETIERYVRLVSEAARHISARLIGRQEAATAPASKPSSVPASPNGCWATS